jgi:polyhydroxybutyrate depolymerase
MLRAMQSTQSFLLRRTQGFVALVLACSACSSDGSDVGTRPAWTNPGFDAPMPESAPVTTSGAAAAGENAPGAAGAGAGAAPGAPSSETPIVPQLDDEPESPGGDATRENGMAPAPGGAEPAGAASEDEVAAPRPSMMCGRGGSTPSFAIPNTLYSLPSSYDGNTPLPVVMAFHAAGNQNTQLRGILGDTLDDQYIMFYPKSAGNGWSNGADAPKVDAIIDALNASTCYDQNRVFATGHSSGAQFIVQRLCAGESRWRAVAPVASSVYCSSWAPIPALVIHGIGDVEREAYGLDDGDGLKDIVPYRTSNGCGETFSAVSVDGCSSGGVQVNPGCRDFEGCSERTRWCQHDDPQYGTSHHGVPCFGARVIKDFFDAYR